MRFKLDLGKNGEIVLKQKAVKEIQQVFESESIPLEENQFIPKANLKKEVLGLLTIYIDINSLEYNFASKGILELTIKFQNGFEITLENTYQPIGSKKELPQRKPKRDDSITLQSLKEIGIKAKNLKGMLVVCSSTLFTPAPVKPQQSKANQAKNEVNLNALKESQSSSNIPNEDLFEFLEEMLPIEKRTEMSLSEDRLARLKDWLNCTTHHEAVRFINSCMLSKHGILPPLDLMSIIIRKFAHPRFGTTETIQAIYDRTLTLYEQENRELLNMFISNYMFTVHSRRSDKKINRTIESEFKRLFSAYPSFLVKNRLIRMYLDANKLHETKLLLDDYNFPPNPEMHLLRLEYLFKSKADREEVLNYFKNIPFDEQDENLCIFMLQYCLRKNINISEAFLLFETQFSPAFCQNKQILHKLMDICIRDKNYSILGELLERTNSPDEMTLGKYIMALCHLHLYTTAIKLYEHALHLGYYKSTQPIYGTQIKLDFHRHDIRNDGTPVYAAYSKAEVSIMILKLYSDLYNKYQARKLNLPIEITFICGRGKGIIKNTILDTLLRLNLSATMDEKNQGQVILCLTKEKLTGMKKDKVERLEEMHSSGDAPDSIRLFKITILSYLQKHFNRGDALDFGESSSSSSCSYSPL